MLPPVPRPNPATLNWSGKHGNTLARRQRERGSQGRLKRELEQGRCRLPQPTSSDLEAAELASALRAQVEVRSTLRQALPRPVCKRSNVFHVCIPHVVYSRRWDMSNAHVLLQAWMCNGAATIEGDLALPRITTTLGLETRICQGFSLFLVSPEPRCLVQCLVLVFSVDSRKLYLGTRFGCFFLTVCPAPFFG